MNSLRVDKCVCHNKTFAALHDIAERKGCTSLDALMQEVEFGRTCALCHPYVRRMLETGETVFHEVLSD